MSAPLLTLSEVSKFYTGAQSVTVGLHAVSLSFHRGEFVAVTGESGSGKSTLAHVVGGILPYESGELLLNGRPTSHYDGLDWERYRRDNVSFVSQNYGILPGATVLRNVVSALVLAGMDRRETAAAAEAILRQVELWDLRGRRAAKLSSGQKQRLSIARALAKPAPILIADEPTGNLDGENSRKVIGLLAQAAAERLVILVTHEFDGVKDLATRHIVLQDGRVASDTELRPAPAPGPAPRIRRGKNRALGPYVARLQWASRPVWSALTAGFFALTAFAVFAFLGVFLTALDDTSTRIYDASAFPNGSRQRIVATIPGSTLDQEDYDAILSIPHVTALEVWGVAADAQYAYRENVDYSRIHSNVTDAASGETYVETYYMLSSSAPFVQTVPLLPQGKTFLLDGRLPENFYEIVSADPDYAVGDTVTVLFTDRKNWNQGDAVYTEMTVVGSTGFGEGLYFHEDVGRFFRQGMEMLGPAGDSGRYLYLPAQVLAMEIPESWTFAPCGTANRALPAHFDGWFRGTIGLFPSLTVKTADGDGALWWGAFSSRDPAADPAESACALLLYAPQSGISSTPRRLVEVSYDRFDALTWRTKDQVSLTIEDYAYTDRVVKALERLGFAAASPYRLGSTRQDPALAAQRRQTLIVCLAALAAVTALQVVLLRAMFSVETESYRLMSNIGLTGRTAKRSVLWQVLAFTLAGQAVGAAGIWLCGQAGVRRIQELLHYLPPSRVLLLSAVHLGAAALAAVWIVGNLGRQVYPLAEKDTDLPMEDEEGVDAV